MRKNNEWVEDSLDFRTQVIDGFLDTIRDNLEENEISTGQFVGMIVDAGFDADSNYVRGVLDREEYEILDMELSDVINWAHVLGMKLAIVAYERDEVCDIKLKSEME